MHLAKGTNLLLVFGHTKFPGGHFYLLPSSPAAAVFCIMCALKKLFLVSTFSGLSNFALVVVFFVLITCDRFVQRAGWL